MTKGFRVEYDLAGVTDTLKSLEEHAKRYPVAFADAVYLNAIQLMTTSLRLTPVDTGFLRKSRWVGRNEPTADGKFQFGMGYAANYAGFVHNIYKHYIVGEWKFLDKAVAYHAPSWSRDVEEYMARLIKAGARAPDSRTHPREPEVSGDNPKRSRHGSAARRARALAGIQNAERIIMESRESLRRQKLGRRGRRPGQGGGI